MGSVDIDRTALLALKPMAGPIVMVNLFRLKDKTQFGAFLQAMRGASRQELQAISAEAIYAGAMRGEFVAGDDHWHTIVLFRYPDWQSFCALLADDDSFERARAIRRQYLDDARFILTTALGAAPST